MSLITQSVGLAGDVNSIGGVGTGLAVDPMQAAGRVSLRPLDHTQGAAGVNTLGQYRTVVATTAILPSANVVLGNFRFVAAGQAILAAVLRVQASVAVVTAVTAQRLDPLVIKPARSYSASETTNASAVSFTTNTGKMRSSFGATAFVAGGQIAGANNAAGMTGGTSTLDANPIGQMGLSGAAIAALGTGQLTADLFRVETQAGEYPFVCANNEGFQVLWGATALATGTVLVTLTYVWAELSQY